VIISLVRMEKATVQSISLLFSGVMTSNLQRDIVLGVDEGANRGRFRGRME